MVPSQRRARRHGLTSQSDCRHRLRSSFQSCSKSLRSRFLARAANLRHSHPASASRRQHKGPRRIRCSSLCACCFPYDVAPRLIREYRPPSCLKKPTQVETSVETPNHPQLDFFRHLNRHATRSWLLSRPSALLGRLEVSSNEVLHPLERNELLVRLLLLRSLLLWRQ